MKEDSLKLLLDDFSYAFVLTDSYTKIIGGPSIYSVNATSFIVGESNEYAMLEPIIIKEDEVVPVLSRFDSIKVIIPDTVQNFSWNDSFGSLIIDDRPVSVSYQGNMVSIPLDSSMTSKIDAEKVFTLDGLGFSPIQSEHAGFNLLFSFSQREGGVVPEMSDINQISSGSVTVELSAETTFPLGTSIDYELPEIIINESTTNVFGKKRGLVLLISEELNGTVNWQLEDGQLENDEVDSIAVTSDTLKVFFNKSLSSNSISLSGIKLTTSEIYEGIVDANSLIKHFSYKTGGITISTTKTSSGYNPLILDTTGNSIAFYPPVILEKPLVYSQDNINMITFPTSPGMFHPDSVLVPTLFQINRTPWITNDISLFSDNSNSEAHLINMDWTLNDSISISNMSFIKLSFSDEDLLKLNLWFDEMHYFAQPFDHFLTVDKAQLPFDQNADLPNRPTDKSKLDWQYYTPGLIKFSQNERIISTDEINDFTLNLGGRYLDTIQVNLLGSMTNYSSDLKTVITDSTFSFSLFPDLQNDLYTVQFSSNSTSGKGMLPIIRQFIVDNNQPQFLDILPKAGISKNGGGHEVSKNDHIKLTYEENLFIENLVDSQRL